MLAMFSNAFGQKEGKVLWDKGVDIKPEDYFLDQKAIVSPSGNTLVRYYFYNYKDASSNYYTKVYDKNGQLLWKDKDYYKKNATYGNVYTDTENKNYTTLNCSTSDYKRDSVFLFDKDFTFRRAFDVHTANTFLVNVEDGVFYSNPQRTLIKYSGDGREEWRFDNKDAINILNQKPPYFGLVFTPNDEKPIFIFDKNGKKKGETQPQTFDRIYPTNDGGFWLSSSANYENKNWVKFDSTGKQTAKFLLKNIITSNLKNSSVVDTPIDNSLVFAFLNENYEVCFLKVDGNGNISKIIKNIGIKTDFETNAVNDTDFYSGIYNLKTAKDGALMYSVVYRYFPKSNPNSPSINKGIVGAEKFNDPNFSWFKTASNESGIVPVATFPEGSDDVIQFNTKYIVDGSGNYNASEISYYELNGKLKSSYSDPDAREILRKGNEVYIARNYNTKSNALSVFDLNTGKLIRQIDNVFVYDLKNYIKIDESGNNYMQYYACDSTGCNKGKFRITKKDGTVSWQYNNPLFYNFNWLDFQLAGNGAIAATYLEYYQQNSKEIKFGLRKISPCEDLNAIAIASNKTEACPTEKVKLSIPKQDGVTYQWQKDGKDLPNLIDAVYDFGESGTYTVVARDELCQSSVTSNALKINIRPLPTAEITAPKSIFCEGDKTVMTATTNGAFFQWQKDQKDIPNATSGIYEVSQAGNYRVGVRDDKCPQVGFSNTYTIITKLLPEASISTDIKGVIYEPFTVKMSANSGTNLAYQWLKDDAIIPNETKLTYEAKKSGKYNVIVTQDGCEKRSDALTISILIPLANQAEIGEEQVQVYPNPSKGEFKIILPKSLKSADIQLFDTFGRERFLIHKGEQAQAEGLTQGIYFLRVQKGERTVTSKLIIE